MTYEYEGKTDKEAIEKAAQELGLEKDQFDVEILESQKKSLFKTGYVKIRVHTVDSAEHVESEFDGKVPNATVRANNPAMVANPIPQNEFEQKLVDFGNGVARMQLFQYKLNEISDILSNVKKLKELLN